MMIIISQKMINIIVTAVETSNLNSLNDLKSKYTTTVLKFFH
jgi:hypothetical protein